MRPKQLQTFLAVVEQAGIRGAARALGVSQPAVTKTVRELERELGAPLVERSVKGVQLTTYGSVFAPRARLLLEEMRRARDEITQLRERVGGRVAVGVTTAVALTTLPAAFCALRVRLPTAHIELTEGVLPTLLAGLRDGSLDFAVAHMNASNLDPQLEFQELSQIGVYIGARLRNPLARSRSLQQLLDAEWLTPHIDGMSWSFESVFAGNGMPTPQRVIHGRSVGIALSLVGHTNMVGFFVEPIVRSSFKAHGIRVVEVQEALPSAHVFLIRRRDSALTPAASCFFECFQSTA